MQRATSIVGLASRATCSRSSSSSCVSAARLSRAALLSHTSSSSSRQFSGTATSGSSSSSGEVLLLHNNDDYQASSRDKSILYFTAKWCPPCQRIAPMYKELASEHKDIHFYKVDIDENRDAAKDAGIMSVPTFMFYKNGTMISKFAGADHSLLEETIDKLKE